MLIDIDWGIFRKYKIGSRKYKEAVKKLDKYQATKKLGRMEKTSRTENIKVELTELEDLVGHQFKNIALLEEAITTGSYVNEHPGSSDYQKLEFLGDRVVSLILAEELFVSGYLDEGKMTFLKSK